MSPWRGQPPPGSPASSAGYPVDTVAIAARLRPRHTDGWASNSSSCRLGVDMECTPRARTSARRNRIDEIVKMPAVDDVDAQRAGQTRELLGARIRHDGDGERRLATVHHARVL